MSENMNMPGYFYKLPGWKPPMAISESRSPLRDLWLILALPIKMYSSSIIVIFE